MVLQNIILKTVSNKNNRVLAIFCGRCRKMAPVTPVIMRVLRPRCYRTSHAVYGIATSSRREYGAEHSLRYRTSHAVYGIATPRQRMNTEEDFSYRTSHAVYGIATPRCLSRPCCCASVTGPVMPFTALQLGKALLYAPAMSALQDQSCRLRHCNTASRHAHQ